jgi:phage tail sheath protein FI
MPDYLAPGVYIEETSYRTPSIAGVSTSTCGMVGQARFGPTSGKPLVLTSLSDFTQQYGDLEDLEYADGTTRINYTAQAVRAFFDNGGQILYVARAFKAIATPPAGQNANGIATLPAPGGGATPVATVAGRYPGSFGNDLSVRVTITAPRPTNILAVDASGNKSLKSVYEGALVYLTSTPIAPSASGVTVWPTSFTTGLYRVTMVNGAPTLVDATGTTGTLTTFGAAYLIELTVAVFVGSATTPKYSYAQLSPFDSASNSLVSFFDPLQPGDPSAPIAVAPPSAAASASSIDGFHLFGQLLALTTPTALTGGNDGDPAIGPTEYDGLQDDLNPTGLYALDPIDEIAIVMAPDAASESSNESSSDYMRHLGICSALITHCENLRYRFAVLDAPRGASSNVVQDFRAHFDTSYAALYYPWVKVEDPRAAYDGDLLLVPPSGSVAGIYARTDQNRGVWKAPANEVVFDAMDFELHVRKAVQEVLNPLGINCLRFFQDAGFRVWGARTMSSDSEWKYVNIRRLFIYLEHSIDKGTQWVVFEPNNENTWRNTRHSVEDFLTTVFRSGALMGTKPEEAFFVLCDRSTMTQNDLDNGRLICEVGVAPAYPAEFVIFRIGQWTASASTQ